MTGIAGGPADIGAKIPDLLPTPFDLQGMQSLQNADQDFVKEVRRVRNARRLPLGIDMEPEPVAKDASNDRDGLQHELLELVFPFLPGCGLNKGVQHRIDLQHRRFPSSHPRTLFGGSY